MTTSIAFNQSSFHQSSFHQKLNSFLDEFIPEFNSDGRGFDQGQGAYFLNKKVPCCIGAHIANFLKTAIWSDGYNTDIRNFDEGIFYLKKILNISESQLKLIFHCAGAPEYPFINEKWKVPYEEVLNNMRFIETEPPKFNKDKEEWLKLERNRINYGLKNM